MTVEGFWQDRRGEKVEAHELEAETVAYLVTERMNIDIGSEQYLAGYLKEDKELPDYSLEAVLKAAGKLEEMIAGKFRFNCQKRKNQNRESQLYLISINEFQFILLDGAMNLLSQNKEALNAFKQRFKVINYRDNNLFVKPYYRQKNKKSQKQVQQTRSFCLFFFFFKTFRNKS